MAFALLALLIGFASVFAVVLLPISEWWLLVGFAAVAFDFVFIDDQGRFTKKPIWSVYRGAGRNDGR